MANSEIDLKALVDLKPGEWRSDLTTRGEGKLVARRTVAGRVFFYYRYTDSAGKRDTLQMGEWVGPVLERRRPSPADGGRLRVLDAKNRARHLSDRLLSGARDLREVLEAEQREERRQRDAEAAQALANAARQRATLGALLSAYVAQLEKAGKASKRDVERSITRNVREPWPVLWETPAEQVTTDDLLAVVARPADANKLREAAKLRSYLQAAYSAAIAARQSAQSLPAMRDLKISSNPARDLAPIQGASNSRERALSVAELRAYWKRIKSLADPGGALLRFHLLTGAQRIEQLGRLTTADRDPDAGTVRLRDTKGRRKSARLHDVPLLREAEAALDGMRAGQAGPFLFTVTAGESGAVYATVQSRLRDVSDAMVEAGEASAPFTPGDLRRTVETRLAALGVPAETRAQLQSHGLGGIQSRHYDKHTYTAEKLDALTQLRDLLTGSKATVTGISQARRRVNKAK